ncbi:MAG: SelB C-terminal domain-containing protein [Acidobacteria bacterium]|nr:SelB C-terminal domain-containing protein [Acidobacteriota bacterium]
MSHIVIGTAGHIDHGKSSLVKALTGTDPDRLKEEQARGITIELGFAHMELGGHSVAFVDVPGHEKFVRTMLAGVGASLEVQELVAGSFLEHAPVVTVSARTGAGLDELRARLASQVTERRTRPDSGHARLGIDRVFSMQGFGTVVTGTLMSGRVAIDDELVLLPGGQTVRVRGVQVHGRRQVVATAGQRTALNLGGIDVDEIVRGQTLASPDSLTVTRRVDALIDLLPSVKPLKHGTRVRFHQGTKETLGRVSIAGDASDIAPGTRAAIRIRLEAPSALTRGDRVILRAYSPQTTIAGGRVLDPDASTSAIRTPKALRRLDLLSQPSDRDRGALAQLIADAGPAGLRIRTLVSRGGVHEGDLAATVKMLTEGGRALFAGERLVDASRVEALSLELVRLVEAFHRAQPLADGIPREEARERVFARADAAVFELVLARLAAGGRLIVRDRIALVGHRLALTTDEAHARDAVEHAYRRGGLKPPDPAALSAEAKLSPELVERMTTLLVRQKRLIRLDTLLFHMDALAGLKHDTQALKAAAAGRPATVDVAAFKDRYGVTRKFAIPLLEWLDRERVTKRVGDRRVVL